jgi:hypothetical protein
MSTNEEQDDDDDDDDVVEANTKKSPAEGLYSTLL